MWRMTTTVLSTFLLASIAGASIAADPTPAAPSAPAAKPAPVLPPVAADPASTCGYLTTSQGEIPTSQDIFNAEITQIDGKSTPLARENRYQAKPGTRVLTVTDLINPRDLPAAAIAQIEKMKRQKAQRAYKKLEVDVQPGVIYAVGARLLRDKLDVESIRNNLYWEPVVWDQRAQPCK
jgi:hypothetical protein